MHRRPAQRSFPFRQFQFFSVSVFQNFTTPFCFPNFYFLLFTTPFCFSANFSVSDFQPFSFSQTPTHNSCSVHPLPPLPKFHAPADHSGRAARYPGNTSLIW